MAEKDHQAGETLGEADDSQLSFDNANLLIQRKSHLLSPGLGCVWDIRRIHRELGPYRRDDPMMESLKGAIESPRYQRFPQQDNSHDSRTQVDDEVGRNDVLLER